MARHVRGDWGADGHCADIQLSADERRRGWEATDDTGKINKWNLHNVRDEIMSEYETNRGVGLWVITYLGGADGPRARRVLTDTLGKSSNSTGHATAALKAE